jgi:hypothetical protein
MTANHQSLETISIQPGQAIGIAVNHAIGDGLIYATLAYNLADYGCQVTLFSSKLLPLKDWFPAFSISDYPIVDGRFDSIFVDHSTPTQVIDPVKQTPLIFLMKGCELKMKLTLVKNLLDVCQKLGIKASNKNGISMPSNYQYRRYPNRVVIHPSSSNPRKKDWTLVKFIKLATWLKEQRYQPVFVVPPTEYSTWRTQLTSDFDLVCKHTLAELVEYLYESGWFIGNDSGPGHLANNLAIPTLSIFRSYKSAAFWRPSWHLGEVVASPIKASGYFRPMWRHLLSVRRAAKGFKRLVALAKAQGLTTQHSRKQYQPS